MIEADIKICLVNSASIVFIILVLWFSLAVILEFIRQRKDGGRDLLLHILKARKNEEKKFNRRRI